MKQPNYTQVEADSQWRQLLANLSPEVAQALRKSEAGRSLRQSAPAKEKGPLCSARTRSGAPCQCRAVDSRARCRLHGGLSTGPKTPEGRARIIESNRRRVKGN
jgi:hypothetical protein